MKRILLFLTITLLLCTWKGNAQLIENFESGIPAGWTSFNLIGDLPTPYVDNPSALTLTTAPNIPGWTTTTQTSLICEATRSAYCDRGNLGAGKTAQSWLVTSAITVPLNGKLSFSGKQTLPADLGTAYKIRISTTSQTDVSTFNTVLVNMTEPQLNPGPTENYNVCYTHGDGAADDPYPLIDLTAYSGQQVYLAFIKVDRQPAAAINSDRWVLDEVRLVEQCLPPTNVQHTPQSISAYISWMGSAPGYEVSIMEGGGTPETGIIHPTNTNNINIEGLTAATTYMYYVRANCADSDSNWVGPFTFTTGNCGATAQCMYTFVLTDTFGDGWNGNTMTVAQNGIEVQVLTLTAGSTATVQVALCDGIPFTLFWNAGGNWAGEVGISVTDPFDEPIYTKAPGAGAQNSLLFTGMVNCTPPPCPKPNNLQVITVNDTSAVLSWTELGSATQWQVIALPMGSGLPTGTEPGIQIANTNNPYTYGGLTPGTQYQFYVRAICGDSEFSDWRGPVNAQTLLCPAENQCLYTFELIDSWGDGWNGNTMSVIQNGVTVQVLALSTGAFASVQVPLCDGIPFTLFWNAGGSFAGEVGINIIDPNEDQIYTKAPGAGSQNSSLFTAMVDCTPPSCPRPNNLQVLSVSDTSVELTWTETGTATQWEVIVQPAGSGVPDGTEPEIQLTNENPYTYEGLTAGTQYEFYVRAVCSDTDISDWRGVVAFQTLVCPAEDQCNYYFVLTDSWGDGWNGNTMSVIQNGVTVANLSLLVGSTTTVPVALCHDMPFTLFWNTGGAFAAEVGISIINTYEEDVYTKLPGVGTPGSTLYTGTADCTPPSCPKPQNVTIMAIGQTSVSLDWTEMGTATLWEYVLLPANQPLTPSTVFTQTDTHPVSFEDLLGGTAYVFYVRAVCSEDDVSNLTIFHFTTLPTPPIYVSTTDYTVPELVEDILIGSDCAEIYNITWSTGTNFGSSNGIGYFEKNDSNFPFQDGILLSTGSAMSAPGPKGTGTQSNGNTSWTGDSDLNNLLVANGITGGTLSNATTLEFDFVALTSSMSFDFIFASEEYGQFQCQYSDVFAFLLTDTTSGITTNLAVVPNTNIPISVTTIRDSAYNTDCNSQNPEYFGIYYNGNDAASGSAAINFRGQTVPMTAYSAVVPGNTYHIKLAIADFSPGAFADTAWDSAVFLLGGSFDLGEVELGADLLVENNTALCVGEEYLIESGIDPEIYDIVWFFDDGTTIVEIPNNNGSPNLIVTQTGTYIIEVSVPGSICPATDSITIEFYEDMQEIINEPEDMLICSTSEFAVFDLTTNTPIMLDGFDISIYEVNFYTSLADAENEINAISNPAAYTNISNPQTIYAHVTNTQSGCSTIKTFDISVLGAENLVVSFSYDSATYCIEGNNPVFIPANGFSTGGTFTSSPTLEGFNTSTGEIIFSELTTSGTYTITYTVEPSTCNDGGNHSVTITINDLSEPQVIFSYADTCLNATVNPMPIGAITPGGVFSSATLSVNPDSGEIDLATATIGTHEIIIDIPQSTNTCTAAGSYTATITITDSITPVTEFEYEFGTYCSNDADATPILDSNFYMGGTFSAQPAGLSINPSTGVINIAGSTPGVYTVKYTVLADAATCREESIKEVTVTIFGEFMVAVSDECIGTNYWLHSEPVDNSFNPTTATYIWTIDGIEVGYEANLNMTAYLNGANIPAGGLVVTVTVNDGCESSAQFTVTSTSCMVQKGISPNSDSANNTFDLTGMGVKKLSIINRYGKEVYAKSNYVNEWNGVDKNGNELPDGTYFYVINKNTGENITGWIYINRKY
jgi:gliding motility-associated-like protein